MVSSFTTFFSGGDLYRNVPWDNESQVRHRKCGKKSIDAKNNFHNFRVGVYYGVDTSWRFKSVAKNLWLSKVQLLRGLHGGVVIYGLVSRSECVASTDK